MNFGDVTLSLLVIAAGAELVVSAFEVINAGAEVSTTGDASTNVVVGTVLDGTVVTSLLEPSLLVTAG